MLWRCCCLCARQLELTNAASSIAPIASTSSHVFGTSGASHTASKHTSRRIAVRSFRTKAPGDLQDQHIEATRKVPDAAKSYWKGKAREVDNSYMRHRPDASNISNTSSGGRVSSSRPSSDVPEPSASSKSQTPQKPPRARKSTSMDALRILQSCVILLLRQKRLNQPPDLSLLRDALEELEDPADAGSEVLSILEASKTGSGVSLSYSSLLEALSDAVVHIANDGNKPLPRLERLLREVEEEIGKEEILDIAQHLCAALARRKNWKAVTAISSMAADLAGSWSESLLQSHLTSLFQSRTPIDPSLLAVDGPGPSQSRAVQHLFLKVTLASRQLLQARQVMRWMRAISSSDLETWQAILEGYRASHGAGMYSRLLQELPSLGIPTGPDTFNTLLRSEVERDDLEAVHEIFTLYKSQKDSDRSLEAGSAANVIADSETFTALVKAYSRLGELDKALDFYTEMVDSGFEPSKQISRAIIQAFETAGRSDVLPTSLREVEGAGTLSQIAKMSRKLATGKDPSTKTRDSITVPISSKPISAPLESPAFDVKTLPNILKREGLAGFRRSLVKMTKQGIQLQALGINMLLFHLASSGFFAPLRLATLAKEIHTICRVPYIIAELNVILHLMAKFEAAALRRSREQSNSVELTPPSPQGNENLSPLIHIVRELYAQGTKPDAYTSAILMQRYADQGGSPSVLWEYLRWQILDRGMAPAPHHIVAIMVAYVNAGDPAGARRAMDRGTALGVTPTVHHYSILIHDLLKRDSREQAERLLQQMQESGIQMDLKLYAIFANWASKRKMPGRVRTILERAQSRLGTSHKLNVVMQTSLFNAQISAKHYWQAQDSLLRAVEAGLVVDAYLRYKQFKSVGYMRELLRRGVDTDAQQYSLRSALNMGSELCNTLKQIEKRENQLQHLEKARHVTKKEIRLTMQAIEEHAKHFVKPQDTTNPAS